MKDNHALLKPEIIAGRNPVLECIKASKPIDFIYIANGDRQKSISQIIALAESRGITIKQASPAKLDSLSSGSVHQGVIAVMSVTQYSGLDDIFALAERQNQQPFIIVSDEIEDPHNLGAIIRTAESAGAHGVIIPKRRSAGLSPAVSKASAGAVFHIPVVKVTNITATLNELKKRGVWVFGADMDGESYEKVDFKGSIAIVLGSEGRGLGRLIKQSCDKIVSIPVMGRVNSLNVSVAAGILMYEALRQRRGLE